MMLKGEFMPDKKEEGSEVVINCHGLKLEASNGKKHE
jgi:hypothetical protein